MTQLRKMVRKVGQAPSRRHRGSKPAGGGLSPAAEGRCRLRGIEEEAHEDDETRRGTMEVGAAAGCDSKDR